MKKYLLLLTTVVAVLSSCVKDVDPEISTDVYAQQTTPDGCEFSVNIKTNAPWTASCNFDDIVITPASGIGNGTATIKVPQYIGRVTKLINVAFTAASDKKSVKTSVVITQESLPFLFCENNVRTVSSEENFIIFRVNSNFQWCFKDAVFSGDEFDVDMDPFIWNSNPVDVCVRVPANTTGVERRVDLILELTNYPQVRETLTVIQNK